MSTIQKVLLVASCILFAATIYSYFNFQIYFVILFFLLHSLCLILFVYRTFSDMRMDMRSMETYHQDIGLEIAGKNKEVDNLKSTLGEKEEDPVTGISDLLIHLAGDQMSKKLSEGVSA